jgi:hypothetical protein
MPIYPFWANPAGVAWNQGPDLAPDPPEPGRIPSENRPFLLARAVIAASPGQADAEPGVRNRSTQPQAVCGSLPSGLA